MNVKLSSPEIKAKLRQVTTDEFYGANRDDLTVRLVRDEVERVLGLEKSFLRSKDWNSKSKDIIKARVQELLELEEESQDHHSDSTNGDERISEVQASFGEGHKNVQQETNNLTDQDPQLKNNCTTERDKENDIDAERTSLKSSAESSEESEEVSRRCRLEYQESASKRRRLVKRSPNHKSSTLKSNVKKKEQQILDNEDCTGNLQNTSSSSMTVTHSSDKSTRKLTTKSGTTKLLNSLNLPDMTREINGTEPIKAKKVSNLVTSQGKEITEGYGELLPDQEEACFSDTSIVYDETPSKTKRKKIDEDTVVNKKKLKRSQQQRQEARKNKDPSMLSSDELTIKNLQSQLRKCGNRKNWSSELKEYGSDTKAKIRHLKRALEAMGMKGRFSEAKARSIKEARELMADVEAVQEGEKKWGLRQENEKSKMTNSTMQKREEEEESDEEEKDNNNKYAHDKKAKPMANQENNYLSDELSLDYRNTKQRDVNGNNMARKSSTRSKSTAGSIRISNRKRPSNALDWLQDEEDSDE